MERYNVVRNCCSSSGRTKAFLVLIATTILLLVVWDKLNSWYMMTEAYSRGKLTIEQYLYVEQIHQPVANISLSNGTNNGSTNNPSDVNGQENLVSCVFPQVDIFKPEILKLAGLKAKTLTCHTFMPDLTYVSNPDYTLSVNTSRLDHLSLNGTFKHCKFQEIKRHPTSDRRYVAGEWSSPFNSSVHLEKTVEFIYVNCESVNGSILSKTYHTLIPMNEKLDKLDSMRLKKRKAYTHPLETLNVVMIGFDGLSRHHFIRAMSRTYKYVTESLGAFDFSMHTQSGVNTFPNFLPLFTGHFEEKIRTWYSNNNNSDPMGLIWQDYERAGYRTLFTEDWPSIGGFHYLKEGFLYSPTSYYSHPLAVAIEKNKEMFSENDFCIGATPEINFHLNYLSQFLHSFVNKPVFGLTMMTKLSHDDMTKVKISDEHVENFLKKIQSEGLLNNTMLVLFSDHGVRFGEIRDTYSGMVESRTPYLILVFPKWFLKKYPDVAKNLQVNTKRLTSHFDTYATFVDLLYFKTNTSAAVPILPPERGISLFKEIPRNRTCKEAGIPLDFCLCGQGEMKKLDVKSSFATKLSEHVVNAVNKKRDAAVCSELNLKESIMVLEVQLSEKAKKESKGITMYKVRVTTKPGNALYEATVTHEAKNNTVEVGSFINRLNKYKGQAECVDEATYLPYCFCKVPPTIQDLPPTSQASPPATQA